VKNARFAFDAETTLELLDALGRDARGRRTISQLEDCARFFVTVVKPSMERANSVEGEAIAFRKMHRLVTSLAAELMRVEPLWRNS
jgi:hypothetical protein